MEQVVAPQYDGQDIRSLMAQGLDRYINFPVAAWNGAAIFAPVENLPAMSFQQGRPADGLRIPPAQIGAGIVSVGIGVAIAQQAAHCPHHSRLISLSST